MSFIHHQLFCCTWHVRSLLVNNEIQNSNSFEYKTKNTYWKPIYSRNWSIQNSKVIWYKMQLEIYLFRLNIIDLLNLLNTNYGVTKGFRNAPDFLIVDLMLHFPNSNQVFRSRLKKKWRLISIIFYLIIYNCFCSINSFVPLILFSYLFLIVFKLILSNKLFLPGLFSLYSYNKLNNPNKSQMCNLKGHLV